VPTLAATIAPIMARRENLKVICFSLASDRLDAVLDDQSSPYFLHYAIYF
jgi:hypothetical protein